jgi:hypothetical protein
MQMPSARVLHPSAGSATKGGLQGTYRQVKGSKGHDALLATADVEICSSSHVLACWGDSCSCHDDA